MAIDRKGDQMDVKAAVSKALSHVTEVFGSEELSNLGLEEVVFKSSENVWEVTVGFSRSWDYPEATLMRGLEPQKPQRQYKVVRVNDESGEVESIKIRELKNA